MAAQFKKGTVTLNLIRTDDETIPCIIHGIFAVHREASYNNKKYWTVTHIPTGSRVARFAFYTQRQAKLYAVELEKLFKGAKTQTEVINVIGEETGKQLVKYCSYVSGEGSDTFAEFIDPERE